MDVNTLWVTKAPLKMKAGTGSKYSTNVEGTGGRETRERVFVQGSWPREPGLQPLQSLLQPNQKEAEARGRERLRPSNIVGALDQTASEADSASGLFSCLSH